MKRMIKQIEKAKPLFEKISRNIYLGAIRDGFLAAMPAILFSSIFILLAALPEVVGIKLPEGLSAWLWKVYNYSMGVVGLLVSATTARALTESMNRRIKGTHKINQVSVMLASLVSFLILSVNPVSYTVGKTTGTAFTTDFLGTKGLIAAFVAAFLTVHLYKFCVERDLTIKMPKEVPGTISQTFRDIFPFSFAVFAAVLVDTVVRALFHVSFAEAVVTALQPLFSAADGYLGIMLIWGAMALFWFVGVHGPSIVEPAIAAIIYPNVALNLAAFHAGEHADKVLTVGLGNFVGTMGGTGATLVVPYLFMLFARSKQLKAVGKASFVPVSFAVNEPLLFATPIILNPYFFVPFLVTPMVNVVIFKFFVDVIGMNSFMYVLPWATPAPLGLILGTGVSLWAVVLAVVLIAVDALIYYPFIRIYDTELLAEEQATVAATTVGTPVRGDELENKGSQVEATAVEPSGTLAAEATTENSDERLSGKRVLVLCAGAGTSAMLANALKTGASEQGVALEAQAGAYGSHYELLPEFDLVILAPQVASYYDDLKADTDSLGVRLVATKGAEYIQLTRDPIKAVAYVAHVFASEK